MHASMEAWSRRPQGFLMMALVISQSSFCVKGLSGVSSDVVIVSPATFQSEVLLADGIVLVAFIAPSNPYCKAILPAWENAATALVGFAKLATIDASEHKSLAQEHGIELYPTVMAFVRGKPVVDYVGRLREADRLVEFALKLITVLAQDGLDAEKHHEAKEGAFYSDIVMLSPSTFQSNVLNAGGIVLVAFMTPWCGHWKAMVSAWEKAASALVGFAKLATIDASEYMSLAQDYGIQGYPTIKAFVSGKPVEDSVGLREAEKIVEYALNLVTALAHDRLDGEKYCALKEKKSDPDWKASLEHFMKVSIKDFSIYNFVTDVIKDSVKNVATSYLSDSMKGFVDAIIDTDK